MGKMVHTNMPVGYSQTGMFDILILVLIMTGGIFDPLLFTVIILLLYVILIMFRILQSAIASSEWEGQVLIVSKGLI